MTDLPPPQTWDDTLAAIGRLYPDAVDRHHWAGILRTDVELVGRLLRAMLQVEHAPVRRGSRAALDPEVDTARLRQLLNEDYSVAPFGEALRSLAPCASVRQIARRAGLPATRVQRLLAGEASPTIADMEAVALAYSKLPIYFREYRKAMVLVAAAASLDASPEASMAFVHRLAPPR